MDLRLTRAHHPNPTMFPAAKKSSSPLMVEPLYVLMITVNNPTISNSRGGEKLPEVAVVICIK